MYPETKSTCGNPNSEPSLSTKIDVISSQVRAIYTQLEYGGTKLEPTNGYNEPCNPEKPNIIGKNIDKLEEIINLLDIITINIYKI